MNPYVLIATHNRLSITKKNIECILAQGAGVILVVSDSGEFDLFKQLFPNISIIHHANMPLGKKWQAGVEIARHLKADPLIINGSDDILAPAFFTRVSELQQEGNHFIGLMCWYVYDLKRVYRFKYLSAIPLGGGRAYSAELLKKIDYKLFDPCKEKHLDDLGYHNVLKSNMRKAILNEPLILSVKGDWLMMNSLHRMFGSRNCMLVSDIKNPKQLLEKFNYNI